MPFRSRNRGNFLRPINRIKHVVDVQQATVAGTQVNTTIIQATDTPTLAARTNVETGSKVNAIFLTVEIVATSSAALSNAYLIVFKNPGGNLTIPAANIVGSNDNKKYVIHQEMVMLQEQTGSNPRTLFKGVIVLPKHYARFAPNDELELGILAPGVSLNVCFQVHFKEFR